MTVAVLQPELAGCPGQAVTYLSYGGHRYEGVIAHVHDDATCEVLLPHPRCVCCPVGAEAALHPTVLHGVAYDDEGKQPHSWQAR